MRNQFTVFALSLLIFAAVAFSALAQKDKENKGKGQQKEQTKDKGQQGRDKDNRGNKQDDVRGNDKADKDKGNRPDKPGRGNDGKDDRGNGNDNKDKDNRGRDGKDIKVVNFAWTPENFRDRDKIRRGQEKVTICHKPNRNGEPGVTITVSSSALNAHMNHGDVMGQCPDVTDDRFSDGYLDRRSDYYNVLVNGQEQVIYSRSILDYALERLTGARSQLVTMQNNNTSPAELERKRLLVVELEDNVSLLRTLLGVTANLVANKLMD